VRLLLDSHALIWAADEHARLGAAAATAMRDPSNQLLLSAASIWEIAIKVGLGELSSSIPYGQWMSRAILQLGASVLPISIEYADAMVALPNHHRDLFDRMLVAQAQVERIPLVSSDTTFDRYGIPRLW
jgi:PIN domain nuclease of toxin-antitoxin system